MDHDHPTAAAWKEALGDAWDAGVNVSAGRFLACSDAMCSFRAPEATARALIPYLPTLAPMLGQL